MDKIKLLMEILKCGVTAECKFSSAEISDAVLSELYSLSKKHDLAHLVGHVLEQNNLIDKQTEIGQKFNQQIKMAIYRVTKIEYDYQEICQVLNDAQIPYIPLKGAVIRRLYPKSWLRTSCDIDILVEEKNLKKACEALIEKGYKKQPDPEFHCVSLTTNSGMNLELHFKLSEKADKIVLDKVWSYASIENGYSYSLTNEFFIFYAVAHIVSHFNNGGCGIRTILDLWLILNNFSYNESELLLLLQEAGMGKFYKNILKLTKVWFENEESNELIDKLQSYILTGGVYGTQSNKIGVNVAKKRNRVKLIFRRLFPPFSIMKVIYPSLDKCPVLLPVYWIRRLFRLVFKRDKAKSAISEVKATKNVSKETIDEMSKMLDELGLN